MNGINELSEFLEKASEGEGSRGGVVIGHTASGKAIYKVQATSMKRYRVPGGGTGTEFQIQDPNKPGGQEHHTYQTKGATPGERRSDALRQHAEKHGIKDKIQHTDFKETARKQANAASGDGPSKSNMVKVAGPNGPVEKKPVHSAGLYHVHGSISGKGFTVTHGPTGMAVSHFDDKEKATSLANHMHENAGDALGSAKFGERPGKAHGEGMQKMGAALKQWKESGNKTEKSMKGIDGLNEFLKSEGAGGLPTGEPGLESNAGNGGAVAGVGAPTGSSDSKASPPPGAPSVPEQKLSEDDEAVGSQLDNGDPQSKPLAKSDAHRRRAADLSRLRKGGEDVTVGEGVAEPEVQAAELEKAEIRGVREGSAFHYTNQSDLDCERLLKSDEFYHGDAPRLGAKALVVEKSLCKSCGGEMSKMLTACQKCGSGATVQKSVRHVTVVEEPMRKSMAPGLRSSREQDLVLPRGTRE